MQNPCNNCDKHIVDYLLDGEYGCDNPCEKAKDFWNYTNNKLSKLLSEVNSLLEKVSNN